MATRRAKREAVVKVQQELTPGIQGPVRRSSRSALAPKRLQYFPEARKCGIPATKCRTEAQSGRRQMEEEDEDRDVDAEDRDVDAEDRDVDAEDRDVEPSRQPGLSAYELERLETIRQNRAFLSSINLFQASEELRQLNRPKPPAKERTRSHVAVETEPPPARKSLRLQLKGLEVPTLPPEPRLSPIQEQLKPQKKPAGPLPMDPVNMEEGSRLPAQLLHLCRESREERKVLDLKEYRSALQRLRITRAKVVEGRVFSADFHPCTSSFLTAAGDIGGNVGLWKMAADRGEDDLLLFQPHTRPVACLRFSGAHASHLLSLSYDGSLRCMDVEKAVFDDVYDIDGGLKTFDFMSTDCMTLVVGSSFGDVAIVDRRTPGNSHESVHSLATKTVSCVSVHPVYKHYMAVSESQTVSIYDSRCLRKTNSQAVSELLGHARSISGAYFSPCAGNRVLTSCMDNWMRVYDTTTVTSDSPLLKTISHNMHTGRWLSRMSAVWDPKQDNCFVVGSMLRPRRVQVFHVSGKVQHTFMDEENLSTVLPVTACHPTRNAFLGGNASGRLHVFSG